MSSEKQESSVLFSLKELMNLEEDRLRQEEQDRQRVIEDEERRRREEEEARLRAEEARLRAEDERRRQEEQRRREEETRLEGIRQAEIEKKRIEAERAAQLEAMSKQQEHARQLALIDQDQSKKKLRNTLIGVGAGSFLLIAGGLGLYFGKIKPEQEQATLAAEADRRKAAEEAEAAKKAAEVARAEIVKLMEDLKGAKDERTRLELEQKLKEAQEAANKKTGVGGPIRPGAGAAPAGPKPGGPKCQQGDPLCGL
jgi:colicin import membrane protein